MFTTGSCWKWPNHRYYIK